MDRREMFTLLGAGALGLAATGGSTARADHEHPNDEHLRTLGECAKSCNEAAHHCLSQLKKGGSHAEHHARAHELTMDSQAFCTLTAALVARSSPMATYAHKACADACRDCAAECERGDGEIMKECAKACRDCEKMCRSMAQSGSQGQGERR